MTDASKKPNRSASAKAEAEAAYHEIKVKGAQLIEKVKEIVEDGNARRVIIKKDGRTMLEFPLSVGVGGAAAAVALAPTLAAVGALAALVTDVQILVERTGGPAKQPPPTLDPPGPASEQSNAPS